MKKIILLLTMCSLFLAACSTEETGQTTEKDTEESYSLDVAENISILTESMLTFNELTTEVKGNRSLLYDDNWINSIEQTLNDLQGGINGLSSLAAPEIFAEPHNNMIKATVHYQFFIDNFLNATSTRNSSLLKECSENLRQGNSLMELAEQQINEIEKNYE